MLSHHCISIGSLAGQRWNIDVGCWRFWFGTCPVYRLRTQAFRLSWLLVVSKPTSGGPTRMAESGQPCWQVEQYLWSSSTLKRDIGVGNALFSGSWWEKAEATAQGSHSPPAEHRHGSWDRPRPGGNSLQMFHRLKPQKWLRGMRLSWCVTPASLGLPEELACFEK